MTNRTKEKSPVVKSRFHYATIVIVAVVAALSARLWYLQIYQGPYYRKISENNRIRRIEIPAARGKIFDQYGQIVLGNRPFYDLVYVPQFTTDRDTTFQILARLLNTPVANFEKMLLANGGRPKFLPIVIKKNLSIHEVAILESNRIFLPGIEVNVAPRRDYTPNTPAHIVGYLGEIDGPTLNRYNSDPSLKNKSYQPGDLVGKQGLELRYEPYLRGQQGHRLIQVDAFGRKTKLNDNEANLTIRPAIAGSDLILTLDLELQKAVQKAFQGKFGSVVAINPKNGDILAMLSSPAYDPAMYQDVLSQDKWRSLINDPYKPLFDKTTGGEFPPGSVYKVVVGLAALEEKVITPNTKHYCGGSFDVGGDTFHCHDRGGHGFVDLREAMVKSCDVYFYQIGIELGVDRIAKYAQDLGLGERLDIGLNFESAGLIPTIAWKKLTQKAPWTLGETPPVAIGQGANLVTPVQMANLYGSIANGGIIRRPRILKKIISPIGDVVLSQANEDKGKTKIIKPETLQLMRSILKDVVMTPEGTGRSAAVEGFTVAGKTGSVQVVSLKKNRNQDDVSMRWREHAMFAAFSPVEDAEIALAIISENDPVGGGGRAAAPIAKAIIERYWQLKEQRKHLTISQNSEP